MDLLSRCRSLKFLAVQQLLLQLLNGLNRRRNNYPEKLLESAEPPRSSYFASFGKGLPDFAVASAVAGGDEVGNAAALQEGGGRDRALGAEEPGEADHLHQSQADHRRLGVVAESQAVAESRPHCDDVLQWGCNGSGFSCVLRGFGFGYLNIKLRRLSKGEIKYSAQYNK